MGRERVGVRMGTGAPCSAHTVVKSDAQTHGWTRQTQDLTVCAPGENTVASHGCKVRGAAAHPHAGAQAQLVTAGLPPRTLSSQLPPPALAREVLREK